MVRKYTLQINKIGKDISRIEKKIENLQNKAKLGI